MPDEVIVVDNNSTDSSVAIARKYPFVKIIEEKNQGIVYARNAGFNAAKSAVLARIDADTNLAPDWVASVRQLAAQIDSRTAYTGPCQFRDWEGKMLLYWGHRVVYFWSSRVFLGHNTLFGSNMFLTKRLWNDIKREVCIRTDIHEDMDLSFHINRLGGEIRFDSRFHATVSPRRIFRMWNYPKMWFKTKLVHRQ